MNFKTVMSSIGLMTIFNASAQVEINRPIQLTGESGDRKITNLEAPVDGTDAANKDYVDSQISNVAGGSNMAFTFSANYTNVIIAPGVSNSATPVILNLGYSSGTPSSVAITVSGLPSGVTHNVSPGGGFPSFTTQLIFTADLSAALGTYPVVVSAVGGAAPQTINFNLQILPRKRVFVTAATWNGNLGGLSGADTKCNTEASAASLSGSYTAWLSTSTVNAIDRISEGLYTRVNGTVIAINKSDLTDGQLLASIRFTAANEQAQDWVVWTGTIANGTVFTNAHCSNWTSSTNGVNGRIGDNNITNGNWTSAYNATDWGGCNVNFGRLYCFEQ